MPTTHLLYTSHMMYAWYIGMMTQSEPDEQQYLPLYIVPKTTLILVGNVEV